MNSKDLRELAPLFSHFDAYRQALRAAEQRSASCDCVDKLGPAAPDVGLTPAETGQRIRRYQLEGRCAAAVAGGGKPANSCLTVVHLGIRAHLATISMPVDHMGDDELGYAVDVVLHGLVLRAPQITQQQFVDQLRAALHADRVVAAETPAHGVWIAPAGTPAPDGARTDG